MIAVAAIAGAVVWLVASGGAAVAVGMYRGMERRFLGAGRGAS